MSALVATHDERRPPVGRTALKTAGTRSGLIVSLSGLLRPSKRRAYPADQVEILARVEGILSALRGAR